MEYKFETLPLREYYDNKLTDALLEGLRKLAEERYP